VIHLDYKDIETGTIQAYVCRGCGYTELYTVQAGSIPVEAIPGAVLLHG
jgi:predicted nucleic-acid-binding Zn-ribbon protein